jgi:uncharacterized protein
LIAVDFVRPAAAGRTSISQRIGAIDVVRGIALFGVLIVNLTTGFRVSIFQQFLAGALSGSGVDGLLARMVFAALELKAFALFSLLFGVGLAIQFEQLSARGRPYYWLVRRLLALLGFGLLHLLLVWNGDILTEYALVGLCALPFLRLRPAMLLAVAAAFLLLYVVPPWAIAWPAIATLQQHVALADIVYSTGGYADIVRFAYRELPLLLPLHLYVLPRTLALFLLGMFLWRVGIFREPARFRPALVIAAAGGIIAALAVPALGNLTPVLLATGYGAAILLLMEWSPARAVLRLFAPLGRMAFTNYLLQSLVCGVVFFGYGLGRFGHTAFAPAFALGVLIYAVQMVLSACWLARHRFGPMEWLWRSLMYGNLQPMH